MHFRQSGIRVDRTGLSVGGAEVCLGIIVSDTILQLVATSASGARQPTMGQRLEDERPEGQNLAQPCLVHDSRTPKRASPKRIYRESPSNYEAGS